MTAAYLTIPTNPPTLIPLGLSSEDFAMIGESIALWKERISPMHEPTRPAEAIDCEWCGGTGHDGFDRCYPPNPYVCDKCDGKGKVSPETALFGRVLLPDEHVIKGDKILLVGGSWITANGGDGRVNTAKDFIEARRPNDRSIPSPHENE